MKKNNKKYLYAIFSNYSDAWVSGPYETLADLKADLESGCIEIEGSPDSIVIYKLLEEKKYLVVERNTIVSS